MKQKINKINSSICSWIEKNYSTIFFILILIISFFIRKSMKSGESGDMQGSLLNWFYEMQEEGIFSLKHNVGNYNVPYQIIISLLTYIPKKPINLIKDVSILFDYLMIVASLLLIWNNTKNNISKRAMVGLSIAMSPLVVINSSYWGQCDSIYVTFLIMTLYFAVKDRWGLSFIMYGIAFAFKLQAIFILPLMLVLWVLTKKFNLLYFIIIPVVNFVLSMPAVIMGRNVIDIFSIYFKQVEEFKAMSCNYVNVYCFTGLPYDFFDKYAIVLALVVLGAGAGYVIYKKMSVTTKNLVLCTIWSVWTCCMFLPAMHERYGYCAEVLLIVYAIVWGKNILIAVAANLAVLQTYTWYLFGWMAWDFKTWAIVNFVAYVVFSIKCVKYLEYEDPMPIIEGN